MRAALPLLLLLSLSLPADLLAQGPPASAPRTSSIAVERLGLRQAVELGLRADPGVLGAVSQRDRGQLGVLRAQLDRFSLRVDAVLQEQYRADNLVGRQGDSLCSAVLPVNPLLGGDLITPLRLLSPTGEGGVPTQAECDATRGAAYIPGASGPQGASVGIFNVTAQLSVPLFTGFRVTANVHRAQHQRDAATANIRSEQRRLALDVIRAYWNVRRAELQQQVSLRALERYDEQVKVVGARVRAGLVPPVDLNRVESRRQREQGRLADLAGAAAEARAQLGVALGLPPHTHLELTEEAQVPPPPPVDVTEVERLLDQADRHRPELSTARYQILAAKDMVRLQQAAYYPQLSGVAWLQFGNNLFNPLTGVRSLGNSANPFEGINGSAFVGADLRINLFDTLNTYTSVRDARYEVERLAQERRRLGRLVESEVRTAHARLVRLYQSREPFVRTRDLAQDTLAIQERRYRNGDALVIDYLDAQIELLNAVGSPGTELEFAL